MPAFTIELPNGKRLDVEADDENAAISGAQGWYKQNVTDKTDTSTMGTLQQGALDIASGVGKTVKEYVSKDAGKSVMDAAASKADPKYKSAYDEFANPADGADKHVLGLDWKKAPRALLEQAPGLAMDVGTQMLLKKLGIGGLGRTIGGMLTFGARTAGNEAQKRTDARTGTEGAEPSTEDKVVGLGSTVAQAALNTLAAGKVAHAGNAAKGIVPAAGNILAAAGTEGATSAAQDLISQGAAKAGTNESINLKDTLAQGVLGTAGGGTFASPHMVKAAAQGIRTRGTDHGDASTYAANRLVEHAGGIENLQDAGTAFKAMKGAMQNAGDEFGREASTITAPSNETANAISRARSGEALSARELAAIDAEGNTNLSSLARELTSLRTMRERGSWNEQSERWAGGVGEFARNHAGKALSALGGLGALPHIAAKGGAGLDTLMGALPGMAQAAGAGWLGYQAIKKIEKAAGIHSPGQAFAERFADGSGQVRPDAPPNPLTAAGVSVPRVTPQNSLTTPQPWGPVAPKPTPFKPDMLDSNLQKIVDKLQNQKRRDSEQQLRALLQANKPAPPAPGMDAGAMDTQIKSALNHYVSRKFFEGRRQAEAEAAESPMINEQGGLDAVRNPAMGKRANELISAANALARLRRQPEETEAPPIAPEAPPPAPQPQPQAPRPPMMDILQRLAEGGQGPTPQPEAPKPQAPFTRFDDAMSFINDQRGAHPDAPQPEAPQPQAPAFALPESPYFHLEPAEAAKHIYRDAVNAGKQIDHPEHYQASTKKRLEGEEAIYNAIVKDLPTKEAKRAFHPYLSGMWGSDSPPVMQQTKAHMLAAMPEHAAIIEKHLTEEKIKSLWAPKRKKK